MRTVLLWMLAGLLLTSCLRGPTPPGGAGTELLWPPPPESPRIQWLQEIRTPGDLDIKPGFWRRLGNLAFGAREEQLVRPYGILSDPQGRLLVADTGGRTLEIFDVKAGKHHRLGRQNGPMLLSPLGLTSDPQGQIYLTDSTAGEIYRLQADGTLNSWATGLLRPTGIVFNPRTRLIYVTDTAAHQIVAFNSQGVEIFRIGKRGAKVGELNFPTDLAVDHEGQLLVTDALNARIQIFSPEGAPVSAFGQAGDVPGTLAKPKGLAVDSDGHIYVCDAQQDQVQIYDAAGQFLLSFGRSGQGPGEFWMPSGIWIDAGDRIYVTDAFNRRIQVFQYLEAPRTKGDNK
ncbi:MAG: 6-bladed beta-propeller [Deltaproteobacteria bacterium HGW-Deltaproteobacteria-4]|nr:MAG: 6-bladed beta-propeller [Deltaproteobacteria bacterium HGW-Deltaproteobacteria-4]